jgi:hypothetical protein
MALIVPHSVPGNSKTWLGKYKDKGRITGDIVSPASALEDWEIVKNVQLQSEKDNILSR